jgi:hypothetical protein
MLIDRGLASATGDGVRPPRGQVPDDLALVVTRIKALMERH